MNVVRIVLLGMTLIAMASCTHQREVEATSPAQAPTVAVSKAAVRNLSRNVVLTAEFKPFQEIDVMAKVAGYVKEIRVDIGDRVQQGQLLAVLEIPEMTADITRAEASLQHSRAEVARARDEMQRSQAAHDMNHLAFTRLENVSKARPGLVALQEIDDAHSRDLQGEAQIAAARSALVAAEEQVHIAEAEQSRIKTMFDYTRVIAPFNGVVTKRFANTGSMIQAGTASTTQAMPIVRLSENDLLLLILPVPESQVPSVRIGKTLEVNVPTLHRTFNGKIARFTNELQLATRTMDTEVDVPNPQLIILPGMYAEVNFALAEAASAISVLLQAIGGSDEKPTILLVNPNGVIEERAVVVGIETADSAEIKAGVATGDMVVIGSRSQLKPGQRVIPKVVEMSGSKRGA